MGQDNDKVIENYNKILEKSHYLEVTAFLQQSLRKLIHIKVLLGKISIIEIANRLKLHEYTTKLLSQQVKNVSLEELLTLKHNLTDFEYRSKTGKIQNPEYYLESLLLR